MKLPCYQRICTRIGIPRELSERMTGGERLATKSIDTKVIVVSVVTLCIHNWNLNGCLLISRE